MQCTQCKKKYNRGLTLLKDGVPTPATFCSYKCYLKFWAGNENFIPLPESN